MRHFANPEFWKRYNALPPDIQTLADRAFDLLGNNPRHPSLHFKKLGNVWSARVGSHYRALAVKGDDGFIWFWIGSHAEYDKLLG